MFTEVDASSEPTLLLNLHVCVGGNRAAEGQLVARLIPQSVPAEQEAVTG